MFFLISYVLSSSSSQINDSIYCKDLKIKCIKNGHFFNYCSTKKPLDEIKNVFGKPDSIVEIDVLEGGSVLYYSNNWFSYINFDKSEDFDITNNSFSVIIDDSLNLKINDPIIKLKKRFPINYKAFNSCSNCNLFSIPFGVKSNDPINTKNIFFDLHIRNERIYEITVTFHE